MRIAVSAEKADLDCFVDARFGRAPYFIIFNTDNDTFEAVSNAENLTAAQGAGVQTAQLVAGFKPDLVISGNIGPKAFAALQTAGIRIASWSEGTVKEAVQRARENKLKTIQQPNVAGHWR